MALPTNWPHFSALSLGAMIEDGTIDPITLTEAAIDRISALDPLGKTFLHASEDRAIAEAIAAHDRAQAGLRRSVLDGVPVAWKDNIEAVGAPTTNGSALLRSHVASRDAMILQRGVRAGFVTLGKTAMTEFAFSGLGYNPTMGSPDNPFDAKTPRAPGGSSCGSAVAVATGLAPLGVGTDTSGSVRIPAAWNGLVGLKTTAGAIPLTGILPLSPTRDTVGALARTVKDAAALWVILAHGPVPDLVGVDLSRTVFLSPGRLEAQTDSHIWEAFASALERLQRAGARLVTSDLPILDEVHRFLDESGNPVAAEGWAKWGTRIEADPGKVFWAVRTRMKEGAAAMSDARFAVVTAGLTEIAARYLAATAHGDAVIMPTVGCVSPKLGDIETPEAYAAANMASLRLTRLANMLGLSALTLPCGLTKASPDQPPLPVGLMLMGPPHGEAKLLRLGAAIERVLPKTPLPIS